MAAGATYIPIATQTLGSAATTVTFSSIPSTYTDLVIITNFGLTATGGGLAMYYNGDTGANYSDTILEGNGSSAVSVRETNNPYMGVGPYWVGASTTLTNNTIINIMNYANTTTYKTMISRGNNPAGEAGAYVGLWRSTAAITSVILRNVYGTSILAGSTFTLYGISAA